MSNVLMKCGHSANGYKQTESGPVPVCVICAGITKDAEIVEDNVPDLTGRKARCNHFGQEARHGKTCTGEANSKIDLVFFEHKPDRTYDVFYCGCWGWD